MTLSSQPGGRRHLRWSGLLAVVVLLLGSGVVLTSLTTRLPAGNDQAHGATHPDDRSASPDFTPTPSTVATPTVAAPTPTPSPELILQIPGAVPGTGTGKFDYARTGGSVWGRSGTLKRFRVAVERDANEDVEEFAAAVDRALRDPASWIGSGRLRLQRVPAGASHDFTVYLATASTAGRMCQAGNVDIRLNGKPYTSCRAPGKVILNLDRWRKSVPHFVAAKVPLDRYRLYVVNHEVGHELGHGHERCPGAGRTAPVMMQQTLFLRGCIANPWPYLKGKRYAGPPL
ncbi:DUF3152 domain-containing protein [Micromonospora sp. NPDC003197]